MTNELSADELVALVHRVFRPDQRDRRLAFLVDMPDAQAKDTGAWAARREMTATWVRLLEGRLADLGLDAISLVLYRNPRANNADLPDSGFLFRAARLPATADELIQDSVSFRKVFETHQILIAPTQFSATAPLKMAAQKFGFRAATMPGFSRAMIPALKLDYGVIGDRVDRLKEILDAASRCDFVFRSPVGEHKLTLDLRHRAAHASGGVFPLAGVAGNLPSGEAYIVPYEGEISGDKSGSEGEIPVQFGEDVVVYQVAGNTAFAISTDNPASTRETERLSAEPAYGNIAELGLGVLGDFGLEPTGEILLDEKLGLHIAFGRSEHFGGQVGPAQFTSPSKVVHIDRVYIPELQPKIVVTQAVLTMDTGEVLPLMKDGQYQIQFEK